jgi:TIR domain
VVVYAFGHYTTVMEWGTDDSQRGHAFISYVREDGRRVDRLQEFLEANGVPVWRDTADLWPGEDWQNKIRAAIAADSLAFIACFSKNSETRQTSYQRDELLLAIEQLRLRSPDRPYLVPVRFDDCPIPDWQIGPGRTLRSLQWVDFFGKQRETNAERLLEGVQHILRPSLEEGRHQRAAKRPPAIVASVGSDSGRPRSLWRPSRFQLLATLSCAAAVVLVTVLGIHLFASSPPHHGSTPPSLKSGSSTSASSLPTSSTSVSTTSAPPGVRVTDDTGTVSVIVPKSWSQKWYGWSPKQQISGITYGTVIGQGLNASPNVQEWFNDLTTPGIFVGASKLLVADHFTPATALQAFSTQCDFLSQQSAVFDHLTGYIDTWVCPHSPTRFETVALWPGNHSFIAFVELKIVMPADEASGTRALDSLTVHY